MPDYEKAARRAARKYKVDEDIFVRQLRQESGLRPGLTSGAGAQGIAQFIPSTAKAYGVNLHDGRVSDDLDGAARYMRDNLKRAGGSYAKALSIYNSGRPDAYRDPGFANGETFNYVRTILGGKDPKASLGGGSSGGSTSTRTTTRTVTPGVDNSGVRKQLLQQYVLQREDPDALLSLGRGLQGARDTPARTTTATRVSGQAGGTGSTGSGASAAVDWARSTVGEAETNGDNRSARIDRWQERFGMTAQAWCAMWTSLAATKGGMPKAGRTASVATIRQQAQAGQGGYKGFVDPKNARPGDLLLFENRHVGMVESVGPEGITMIAGNDSNRVSRRVVAFGSADVVRPRYRRGAR